MTEFQFQPSMKMSNLLLASQPPQPQPLLTTPEALAVDPSLVKNPALVWMQLRNAREVLSDPKKWNSEAWFRPAMVDPQDWTMCLANALRFVSHGDISQPADFGGGELIAETEAFVLGVIRLNHPNIVSIPEFNDTTDRHHREVLAVLDKAIELIAPFAGAETTVFASETLTKAEKEEMAAAAWKAQQEIWREQMPLWWTRVEDMEKRGWKTWMKDLIKS